MGVRGLRIMNFCFMFWTRIWELKTCSRLWFSNSGPDLSRGFLSSRYLMNSSSVGVANGPRLIVESIIGSESLCVTVT